jgi:hypothetical protein
MEADDFGIEQIVAEDRFYRGSRFRDVRAAVFCQPLAGRRGREGALRSDRAPFDGTSELLRLDCRVAFGQRRK